MKTTSQLEETLYKAWEELGVDWGIKITCERECMWDVEVRLTPFPHSEGSDISTVLFIGGIGAPEDAAARVYDDVIEQLANIRRFKKAKTK